MVSTWFQRAAGAGVVALAVGLGWSGGARADEALPRMVFEDGADLPAQVRELYGDGVRAARRGDWELARVLYARAFRAQRHWRIAGSLGHAEVTLGSYRDAAEHLAFFLRETRDLTVDVRDRASLARDMERAQAKVAAVMVTVDPPGAEVLVDGAPVGAAPLADAVFVEPGRHLFDARLDGRRFVMQARELVAGEGAEVTLRPAPPVAAAAPPLRPVVMRAPDPPRAAPVGPRRAIVIGGASASAVLAVVGAGLAGGAASKASASAGCEIAVCGDATSEAARRQEFDRLQSQKVGLADAAIGTFVGAGVVAAGTVAYALVTGRLLGPPRTGSGNAPSTSIAW